MKYYSAQKGFTLVEMVVSLAIFSIVSVVAVGALLRITDANKKSQTLKTAINNLNFAMESMSREMRVGTDYNCGSSVNLTTILPGEGLACDMLNENWTIAFNSTELGPTGNCSLIYVYQYDHSDQTLNKAKQSECGGNIGTFYPLISPDVKITESIVKVTNTGKPRVFFWLKGHVGDGARNKTEFELQTTVSQRVGT